MELERKNSRTSSLLLALLVLVHAPLFTTEARAQEIPPATAEQLIVSLSERRETEPAVPRLVKLSGHQKDATGRPRTGIAGMTFALYRDQTGGSPLWLETQNVYLDDQGSYSVILGSSHSNGIPLELFASGEARWLGIRVLLPGEEEQERLQLISVPYALKAGDAATLGGKPLSAFLLAPEEDSTDQGDSAHYTKQSSSSAEPKSSPPSTNAIVSNPDQTQTISAPPKVGVVPLQIQGHPQDGANLLEIFNSKNPPSLQSYFDLNGAFRTSQAPTFSTTTSGSILFAGTGGLLSQNNSNLFWDNTGKSLRVGPRSGLDPTVSWVPPYGQSSFSTLNTGFDPGAALALLNQDNTVGAESHALWATAAGTNASGQKSVVGGLASEAYQVGNGNATWMLGLLTNIGNLGSGTINLARHVAINPTSNIGGGTINDNYGIKVENQTAGTNNWALRTGLGKVQFGDDVIADKNLYAKAISSVRYADQFAGANAGAKIMVAIADLPATGGTVDARGFEGTGHTITSDMFAGVTKPGKLLIGAATFTVSATQNVPDNWIIEGIGPDSIFSYTGTGNAFSLNPGTGTVTQWNARLKNFRITTSTGAAGIYLKDIHTWTIEGVTIDGFSNAGILSDPSAAPGGVVVGTIQRSTLSGNGRGIRFISQNIHNQIVIGPGNRIVSSTAGPGLSMDQAGKGIVVIGNDFSGNTTHEISATAFSQGLNIIGNWFETSTAANNAIYLTGPCSGCTHTGTVITGNSAYNNAASATGRFLLMNSTSTPPGFTGLIVRGNYISGYGNTTNPAIDFGGKTFANSDFSGNFFAANVTTPYGNLPAAASTSTIVRGIGNTDQNGKITALSAGTVTAAEAVIQTTNDGATPLTLSPTANPSANLLSVKNGAGNVVTGITLGGSLFMPLVTVTFSATPDFNAFAGNTFKMTLTDNVTSSTISNATTGQSITLLLCQDATGSRTMTWPTNLKLSGGAFTLTTTASKCDSLTAVYDGSNWYETARANNM